MISSPSAEPVVDLSGLRGVYRPPAWATGYISGTDAEFLARVIADTDPQTVLELGVASGASSAAILFALDQLPERRGGRTLLSCDVRATCYFDEAYATGQACREMYPAPRARWQTNFAADARALSRVLAPSSVDLIFIDANHAHPWPLLDVLHLSEVAADRAWMVLHDIELPVHHPEYQIYGPRWVYEEWPCEKFKGVGQWTSIGAVRLPHDIRTLAPMALALLDRPWEHSPKRDDIALPAALSDVEAAIVERLATTPATAR